MRGEQKRVVQGGTMGHGETTVSDAFSLRGQWWLPGAPDRRVAGVLDYTPTGKRELSLDGCLADIGGIDSELHVAKVIYGTTPEGMRVTVGNAFERLRKGHSAGEDTSAYCYDTLFIGNEWIDPEGTPFVSAAVEFSNLGPLFGNAPFEIKRIPSGESKSSTVTYKMPQTMVVRIPSIGAQVCFDCRLLRTQTGWEVRQIHSDFVRIEPSTSRSVSWYLEQILYLRRLVSILAGDVVDITSLRLCHSQSDPEGPEDRIHRQEVAMCLGLAFNGAPKQLHPHEVPFGRKRLGAAFEAVVRQWFGRKEVLDALSGLYFGTALYRNAATQYRFMALMQGLESFQRETCPEDGYLPASGYEPIRNAIVQALPASLSRDHRQALEMRIKYGNEYSLRKRLKLLLRSLPGQLADMITENWPSFVEDVVVTRNHFAHGTADGDVVPLSSVNLLRAFDRLATVAEAVMLRECGIPDGLLVETMMRHHYYVLRRARS